MHGLALNTSAMALSAAHERKDERMAQSLGAPGISHSADYWSEPSVRQGLHFVRPQLYTAYSGAPSVHPWVHLDRRQQSKLAAQDHNGSLATHHGCMYSQCVSYMASLVVVYGKFGCRSEYGDTFLHAFTWKSEPVLGTEASACHKFQSLSNTLSLLCLSGVPVHTVGRHEAPGTSQQEFSDSYSDCYRDSVQDSPHSRGAGGSLDRPHHVMYPFPAVHSYSDDYLQPRRMRSFDMPASGVAVAHREVTREPPPQYHARLHTAPPPPPPPLHRSDSLQDTSATATKPPHSYATLIAKAIMDSPPPVHPEGRTLKEIYAWLEDNYPYFRRTRAHASWRSSVRHNLVFSPLFKRTIHIRAEDGMKTTYWNIAEDARERFDANGVHVRRARNTLSRGGSTTASQQQLQRQAPLKVSASAPADLEGRRYHYTHQQFVTSPSISDDYARSEPVSMLYRPWD